MITTTFTDISNWQKNTFYNTGGTRSKYVAMHPESNDAYFFKGSKETPEGEIRYPMEFWSEIVSSKIGASLGFPLLDYNIAYDENHKQKVGCISKTMIADSSSKLTEGKDYLTGANPKYNPDQDKKDYTFQLICEALKKYNLEKYIDNIIEIIVFDSLVGNSDRHQENWGIITSRKMLNIKQEPKPIYLNFLEKAKQRFKKNSAKELVETLIMQLTSQFDFAPIYDSGCCLGREQSDETILKQLKDKQMLEAYINRGKSEIHWKGFTDKKKHFELVNLLLTDYQQSTHKYISNIHNNYNVDIIKEIIYRVDDNLPESLFNFKLPNHRKELMFKLVTLRAEKLMKLL